MSTSSPTRAGPKRPSGSSAYGDTPWDNDGDFVTEFQGLMRSAVHLLGAAKQIARTGDPAQMERATTAIRATGKELYKILAED